VRTALGGRFSGMQSSVGGVERSWAAETSLADAAPVAFNLSELKAALSLVAVDAPWKVAAAPWRS